MVIQRFSDEQSWKQALLEGQAAAFKQAYEASYSSVAAMVRNNNGSSDDAQDLFQDTLIVLVEKLQRGNLTIYDGVSVNTFIGGIARRQWLKVLEKRGKRGTKSLDDLLVLPSDVDSVLYEMETGRNALFEQDATRVKACLSTMTQERILLILLRFSLGYDYPDIMKIMNIQAANEKDPARNVRQRLFDGMNALKGCMTK
jgi:DNA-directed RNA polymerase specialized sigma24 family protein